MSTTASPVPGVAAGTTTGTRPASRRSRARLIERRVGALLLAAAGLAMGAGGMLHPHGSGDTLDEALGSMLGSSMWGLSHVLVLTGIVIGVAGFVLVRRSGALDAVCPWITVVIVAWALAAIETLPHLLAGAEHAAHAAGEATPMTDAHLTLSVFTTPLMAFTTAILAVQLARRARTALAWILAAFAIAGALTFGIASPLLALTGDPAMSALFPGQLLIDVWLIGTAVRLWAPPRSN
ncbi:hypothetical protein [Microbacterium sp.]|uniref:hypothetical protein n=1 Tax=Microbacterium sp. TaxID=51671 RepID=UPI003C7359B9